MKQFKWRLFLSYLAVILVVLVAAQIYASFVFKEMLITRISSDLKSKTYLIKTAFQKYSRPGMNSYELDSMLKDMGRALGARITVIGLDGRVVGDSEVPKEDVWTLENHAHRPEFIDALRHGFGTSVRFSMTLQKDMLYAAALCKMDVAPDCAVRLALPLDDVDEKIAATQKYFLMVAAVGIAIAFFLNLGIAHWISRPIRQMTLVAKKIAEGDFEQRIYKIPAGELGILAKALDSLSSQLKTKITEIVTEKDKNEAVLRGVSEGIMAIDSGGRIIFVNDTLKACFTIDQDVSRRFPLEVIRSTLLQEAFQHVLQERAVQRIEIPVAHPRERVFEVNIVPFFSEDTLRGAIAAFHDVTDIKRLDQVRKDFVANVSHELKNPLAVVKGYSETLLDEGVDDREKAKSFIRIIKQNVNRMDSLIGDILTLAKLESQRAEISPEKVNLKKIIENSIKALSSHAARKNIEFMKEFPREDMVIQGDPDKISQAVLNIIGNAIKYSPPKTEITISLLEREGGVQIDIQDEGPGIPKEDQDRIFERFYRVDKGRSRAVGGTGLGLSIVKHAVLSHKGKVWVDSEPEQGSIFHILLPKGALPISYRHTLNAL